MRAVAALIATVLVGVSACSSSGHSSDGGNSTPISVTGSRTLTGKELSYGPSVGAIPGAVYQSDKRDVLSAKELAGWILVACAVCAHPPMVSLCYC